MGYEFGDGHRSGVRTAAGNEFGDEFCVAPGPRGATVPPASIAPAARTLADPDPRQTDPPAKAQPVPPPAPRTPGDDPAPCDRQGEGWWILPAVLAGALVWSAILALAL